jgi:hypothetical protein
MSTLMTVSELQEIREKVRIKLSQLPEFALYEKLTMMLTYAEQKGTQNGRGAIVCGEDVSQSSPLQFRISTTSEQKERILKAVHDYFEQVKNAPTTMRDLVVILRHQGLEIPGKNSGTTLGAIVAKSGSFELCDKKKRLWKLKSPADSVSETLDPISQHSGERPAGIITALSSEASDGTGEVAVDGGAGRQQHEEASGPH